jgi:hypothetical protein
MKIRVCQICHKEFKAYGKRRENIAKYCSLECKKKTDNPLKNCIMCGSQYRVLGIVQKTSSKYCSMNCKADYQSQYKTGENSNRWMGGVRKKNCTGCGKTIYWKRGKPYSSFTKQMFCTKICADKHGFRYKGENHPCWKGGTHPRDMRKQAIWSKAVRTRDNFTCQWCNKRGVDLHAHHLEGFTECPEKRWDINNGITLCVQCHYTTYKFYRNQYRAASL